MELTDNLRVNVKDVDTYLASTNMQINTLLDTNYREFQSSLFNTLDSKRLVLDILLLIKDIFCFEECSDIVLEQLAEYSNATALTEVVNIVNGLAGIKDNLMFMKRATNELRVNASQLNDGEFVIPVKIHVHLDVDFRFA